MHNDSSFFVIESNERTRSVRVCWSYKLVCTTMLFSFPSWISLAYQLKSSMSDIELDAHFSQQQQQQEK